MVILKIIYRFDFGPSYLPTATKGPLRHFMVVVPRWLTFRALPW